MYYMGLDIETDDPLLKDRGKQKAKGPSWIFGQGRVICTGLYNGRETKAFDGDGGDFVRGLLLRDDVTIVGANIQYDIGWLLSSLKIDAFDIKCHFIDIAIVESLIDEYQEFSLDALALKYLKEHKQKSVLEGIAEGLGLKGDFREHLGKLWDEGYSREIRDYVMSDADQPMRIWNLQKEIIERDDLWEAFHMDMDMIPVVVAMQQKGVRIDVPKWKENCGKAREAYERLKREFETKYGKVNINSPKQLAELLDRFEVPYRMKITVKGYQPEGRKFTDADRFQGDELTEQKKRLKEVYSGMAIEKGKLVLYLPKLYAGRACTELLDKGYCAICNPVVGKPMFAEFAASYPIVSDLVQYKQVKNIVDKFLGPVFGRFIAPDNRLHGNFNIVGARNTGRLSCKTPNLQQCVAEGTRVLTQKGYVPIENIRIGDLIFNGNGDLTKVTNVWYKGIKNCTWTVCANNQFKIATTPDHKFWNGKEWQKAEELRYADVIQSRTGFIPLQALSNIKANRGSAWNKQSNSRNLGEEVYAGRGEGTTTGYESQENSYGLYTRGNSKRFYSRIFVPAETFIKRFMSEIQNISKNGLELSEILSNERAESRTTCFESGTGKILEERTNWEKASYLQRGVYGWSRIYNLSTKRSRRVQKSSNTSSCVCPGIRYRGLGFAKVPTCTSCRQKPLKQQLGQLGALFTKSTWNVTQTACGLRKVYDIEVASSDHSFIAEGFRVHNCPSKCRLFEKTDHEVDLAHMCREVFIPEPGEAFVKLDYSGQENRVVAHFAFGKNGAFVQKQYNDNPYFDEHDYVAKVSGLEEAHGKKVGRKFAKNLRFGVSYGMQKPTMMKNFGWTKEFCDDLYEKVAGAAPWLFEVMDKVQVRVLQRRFIKTLAGRHEHLRKGRDKDAYKYMNYLIQGSAADMTKKATVAINKSRKNETMILTVHDEDCFSVPMTEEGVERVLELQRCMEHSSELRVPAVCNPEIGPNWADGIEWCPEYGDVKEFVRRVFKSLKEGTFYKLKEKLGEFEKGESFSEFCESLEEDWEDGETV